MRNRDQSLAAGLLSALDLHERAHGKLPGIAVEASRETFVEQLVDSVRRVKFVLAIRQRSNSAQFADATSDLFDPLKGALFCARSGDYEEACWLVFLAIHCGRHGHQGWRLMKDLYRGDGKQPWTWLAVSADVSAFRNWLEKKNIEWRKTDSRPSFGSHRNRESFGAWDDDGIGAVVSSYVTWVLRVGSHRALVDASVKASGGDHAKAFAILYEGMTVRRFGRLAKFDFLCMLGKLGLAQIEPGTPYIEGSSGPLKGARRMFGKAAPKELDRRSAELARSLGVNMQVMEDALCNWQKSPTVYKPFRG